MKFNVIIHPDNVRVKANNIDGWVYIQDEIHFTVSMNENQYCKEFVRKKILEGAVRKRIREYIETTILCTEKATYDDNGNELSYENIPGKVEGKMILGNVPWYSAKLIKEGNENEVS